MSNCFNSHMDVTQEKRLESDDYVRFQKITLKTITLATIILLVPIQDMASTGRDVLRRETSLIILKIGITRKEELWHIHHMDQVIVRLGYIK